MPCGQDVLASVAGGASRGTSAAASGEASRAASVVPASQGPGTVHAGSLNEPQPAIGPQSVCEHDHVPATHTQVGAKVRYANAPHCRQASVEGQPTPVDTAQGIPPVTLSGAGHVSPPSEAAVSSVGVSGAVVASPASWGAGAGVGSEQPQSESAKEVKASARVRMRPRIRRDRL